MTDAGVSFFAVLVIVMIASDFGIEVQFIGKQCIDSLITRATDTAVKLNTDIGKCHLRTASDAAADQYRYILLCEKSRKRAVTAATRIHDLGRNDLAVVGSVLLAIKSRMLIAACGKFVSCAKGSNAFSYANTIFLACPFIS